MSVVHIQVPSYGLRVSGEGCNDHRHGPVGELGEGLRLGEHGVDTSEVEQIEGGITQDGEDRRSGPEMDLAGIFPQEAILLAMDAVLDGPVPRRNCSNSSGPACSGRRLVMP